MIPQKTTGGDFADASRLAVYFAGSIFFSFAPYWEAI